MLYILASFMVNLYICIVIFFIVLDLRLTRLGESVLPFFISASPVLFYRYIVTFVENINVQAMKQIILYIILLFAGQTIVSCTETSHKEKTGSEQKQPIETKVNQSFPFPDIPVIMTRPEERRDYLILHYWDNFNFTDTVLVNDRNITEQGLVNYLALLADRELTDMQIQESLGNFCSGMEKNIHARELFMEGIDSYLYDPNSPYYNESLYIVYLERMLRSEMLDDARKSTLKFKLELARRNRPGEKASPFVYYLPDGSKQTLAQTPAEGNRLLLVFYDPECPSCHEIMKQMWADRELAAAVEQEKLTVLAVYTEGNEELWKKTVSDMPKGWIVGQDHQAIKEAALYDLKAMPSLYLLDGSKRVILKDAPYETICVYLGIGLR